MRENKQRNLSKGIFVEIHLFLFSFCDLLTETLDILTN